MRWIHHFTLVAVIVSCWGKGEDNHISEQQFPIKLDTNLRKALLKALNELEKEEKLKLEQVLQVAPRQLGPYTVTADNISNGALQKAPVSSFSIITQSDKTSKPKTTEKKTALQNVTEKPIVVIQKSSGIQHRPITSFVPTFQPEFDPTHDSDQFIASASSSFTGAPKFQSLKSSTSQPRSVTERINPNLVSITVKPRTIQRVEATTAAPIITSSTEESEAKVEDVQFFAAPLVAAFTVHHDELGLPKSVEPIYKVAGQTPVSTNDLRKERLKQIDVHRQKQRDERYKEEQIKLQEYLRHQEQIRVQVDLQEKQRILEQQIRSLQQQQQHQDYLLRQQQLYQEQNVLQQRQKLLEDQKVLLKNQQNTPSSPVRNSNQNRFNNIISNQAIPNSGVNKGFGSSVSFQPSITFQPAPQIDNTLLTPSVTQQLPIRSSGDFRQSHFPQLPIKTAEDFRQPPQYPPLSDQQFTKFNVGPIQAPPLREFQNVNFRQNGIVAPQSNRVFRHESGTGNFLNTDYNNRNNFFNPSPPQSNRFFRSNPDTFSITPSVSQDFRNIQNSRPQLSNNQLNNLLYYSGITRGNQQEDLNIVSKVLSLNHLGVDNFFGGSQILEQRLIPPQQNLKT